MFVFVFFSNLPSVQYKCEYTCISLKIVGPITYTIRFNQIPTAFNHQGSLFQVQGGGDLY